MKKNNLKRIILIIGLILIVVALYLIISYNLKSNKAEKKSKEIYSQLIYVMEQNKEGEQENTQIDGNDYLGAIQIQALNLELPVMNDWNYNKLEIAPCRYKGSLDNNDLIICAHNYKGHFGQIENLNFGDIILIKNMSGEVFKFKVEEKERINYKDIEQMNSGDWDLTLFTCDMSARGRIAVRCVEIP